MVSKCTLYSTALPLKPLFGQITESAVLQVYPALWASTNVSSWGDTLKEKDICGFIYGGDQFSGPWIWISFIVGKLPHPCTCILHHRCWNHHMCKHRMNEPAIQLVSAHKWILCDGLTQTAPEWGKKTLSIDSRIPYKGAVSDPAPSMPTPFWWAPVQLNSSADLGLFPIINIGIKRSYCDINGSCIKFLQLSSYWKSIQ